MNQIPTGIQMDGGNAENAANPIRTAEPSANANLSDVARLVLKMHLLIHMVQQSVLLLMIFGLSLWAMQSNDSERIFLRAGIVGLFTACSVALLKFGLPKQ